MSAEEKLRALGLQLPFPGKPVGAYVPAVRTGNLIYTAGQLPLKDGQLLWAGKVGHIGGTGVSPVGASSDTGGTPVLPSAAGVSLPDAQAAARQACLNALAAIRSLTGSLDAVRQVVRLNVFVNSAEGFTDQAKVANGASELLVEIFGDAGRHTRCALGAAELPLNSPVELDLIVEVS